VQGVFSGTHEGPLLAPGGTPIPATHNRIRIALCLVLKIEAGRAVEVHEYNDQLSFLSQLGLIL
jgi:predicted ester cyclase